MQRPAAVILSGQSAHPLLLPKVCFPLCVGLRSRSAAAPAL